MASWPHHLLFGNQKRFWRDPVKRAAVRAWRVLIYEALLVRGSGINTVLRRLY